MSDPHLLAVFTKAGHMFEQLNWSELWIVKRNKTNLRHGGLGAELENQSASSHRDWTQPQYRIPHHHHQQWAPKNLAFEKLGPSWPSLNFLFGKLSPYSDYYCFRSTWYLVLDLLVNKLFRVGLPIPFTMNMFNLAPLISLPASIPAVFHSCVNWTYGLEVVFYSVYFSRWCCST